MSCFVIFESCDDFFEPKIGKWCDPNSHELSKFKNRINSQISILKTNKKRLQHSYCCVMKAGQPWLRLDSHCSVCSPVLCFSHLHRTFPV